MKKLTNINYKGIEYIQLSALPTIQVDSLKQTLNKRTLIKILMDDVILNDCVLYYAYEKWFDSYVEEVKTPVIQQSQSDMTEPATLA